MTNRLKQEGSETVTNCHRLELEAKNCKSMVTVENFLPLQKTAKRVQTGKDAEAGDE